MNIPHTKMRLIAGFIIALALCPIHGPAMAAGVEEIESDIERFQNYFLKRFPDLEKQAFSRGVTALPQYARRMQSWLLLMALPPYRSDLALAQKEWLKPFKNGGAFGDCFSRYPKANEFPYFDGREVLTIARAINNCLIDSDETPLDWDSPRLSAMVAAFKARANGSALKVDITHPEIRALYDRGRQFFWARRGQNNFSCASCHVENSGNRLRGEILSAALGHGSGFPVYVLETHRGGKHSNWISLHRRYAACTEFSGAAPFAPQSPQYLALEVYQAVINTGIPINAPGFRQ